jgi:hypothetical protein
VYGCKQRALGWLKFPLPLSSCQAYINKFDSYFPKVLIHNFSFVQPIQFIKEILTKNYKKILIIIVKKQPITRRCPTNYY